MPFSYMYVNHFWLQKCTQLNTYLKYANFYIISIIAYFDLILNHGIRTLFEMTRKLYA